MEITPLALEGVFLIKPRRFSDARGYFAEIYNRRRFSDAGIKAEFVQDNQSYSSKAGTVRGLHFQYPPFAQAKLVRALHGRIFDVAVDLRRASPTLGHWIGQILTADGGEQLFIPRGFAHGFCSLEDDVEVAYKVDAFYSPECDSGLIWNDPAINIDWPIDADSAILSNKDTNLGFFKDFNSPFN
ncbi:MAG TPA: dTDP-4-dehydrorhamnose 3,5-epimerase [Methylocella sp.]|nr:dTDP-4-dehydrorhamnose 3,5-epimerase [Methylocella sp.]